MTIMDPYIVYKLLDWIPLEKLNCSYLSENPKAIQLLEENPEKINWTWLSHNPNAIHLLEQNQEKIWWSWLSGNPNAIHLLEENPEKINWYWLSMNPNAIQLLEQNLDKIDWVILSNNPSIFKISYNYDKIKLDKAKINEDIIAYYWRPSNMDIWMNDVDDLNLYSPVGTTRGPNGYDDTS